MSETADTNVCKRQGGVHNSKASTEEDISEKQDEAKKITVGVDIPRYREDCKSLTNDGIGHSPGDEVCCTTRDHSPTRKSSQEQIARWGRGGAWSILRQSPFVSFACFENDLDQVRRESIESAITALMSDDSHGLDPHESRYENARREDVKNDNFSSASQTLLGERLAQDSRLRRMACTDLEETDSSDDDTRHGELCESEISGRDSNTSSVRRGRGADIDHQISQSFCSSQSLRSWERDDLEEMDCLIEAGRQRARLVDEDRTRREAAMVSKMQDEAARLGIARIQGSSANARATLQKGWRERLPGIYHWDTTCVADFGRVNSWDEVGESVTEVIRGESLCKSEIGWECRNVKGGTD